MSGRYKHYLKGYERGFTVSWASIVAIYALLEYNWLLAYPSFLFALFSAYLADEEAKE